MILSLVLFLVGGIKASEFSGLSPTQQIAIEQRSCRLLQVEPSDFSKLGPSIFMLRVPKEVRMVVPHYTGCDTVTVFKMDHGAPVPIVARINGRMTSVLVSDHYGDKYYVGVTDGQEAITAYGDHYDNAGIPPVIENGLAIVIKATKLPTTCYSATTNPNSRSISFISCR